MIKKNSLGAQYECKLFDGLATWNNSLERAYYIQSYLSNIKLGQRHDNLVSITAKEECRH